jgi:predicted deacylase
LKQNHIFFLTGLIIAVAMVICAFGFQLIRGSASIEPTRVPTAANVPRLLALETNLPPQPTAAFIPATLTKTPPATPTQTTLKATATPLFLSHEQQPDVIGYSVENRPIRVYTFGNGEHERMIVADIHGGDEWNTLTLANQLIHNLNQYPNTVPEDVTFYILPSLNPDGEARSHDKYGRLNANGVDLNRNFPVNWLADWERAGCWNYLPTSGGTGPGSEVETQVLMDFITAHNIEVLISYHSAALGIFPGGDPRDQESVRLAESIAQVSSYPYPPLDTGCTYSGSLPDFAVSQGIAAVDIELTNHIETDLDQNLNILEVLLNWQTP